MASDRPLDRRIIEALLFRAENQYCFSIATTWVVSKNGQIMKAAPIKPIAEPVRIAIGWFVSMATSKERRALPV